MFSAHCIVTGICAKITDNYLLLACFDNFDINAMLSFNVKYFFKILILLPTHLIPKNVHSQIKKKKKFSPFKCENFLAKL